MKIFASIAMVVLAGSGLAGEFSHHHQCGWEGCAQKREWLLRSQRGSQLADEDDKAGGVADHYARDRKVDIAHVKLDITPDFDARTVAGVTVMRFAPVGKELRTLELDAVDLEIESIGVEGDGVAVEDFQITDEDKLEITFENAIAVGAETTLTIRHRCEPRHGWYFRTEAMGYPPGDDHAWTQGEPEKHRHWFPCYDYPNERFTSEVICHVPEGMTVLSNGRLLGTEKNDDNGLVAFHWLQDKPHVNYLISVVAGFLEKLEADHDGLPLAFYTPPSEFENAANSFRDTRAIIAFFEKEIGVDYPWDKYYSVCVADFIAGGMENTSVTTLTTGTLFSTESENLHTSHQLDAHEAAHQWFGDLVTCQDWSQLWLNEGFATYYTQLYEEEKNGRDDMLYGMYRSASQVLRSSDTKPITWRGYEQPMQQFDYRAYPKGAWVLHMLRSQLGAEMFRECIRTYLERHRDQVVVTRDLMEVFEEISGRSWERFFDQWVHHGGDPELKISYAWDQEKKKAKITVEQKQAINDKVMLFHLPLPVCFHTENGIHDFVAQIDEKKEVFWWALPEKPTAVRIDPEYTVLAKIDFKPAKALLHAQLELEDDMMGRLFAVQQLADKDDAVSIDKLKESLNGDAFYGVRMEAAKALAKIRNDKALAALLDSRGQEDARVRQEVVYSLGKFFDDQAYDALVEVVNGETNPDIVASAVNVLGKYPGDGREEILLTALRRDSFRNQVAVGAISAARVGRDESLTPAVLDYLRANESKFVSRDFASALNSLATLASNREVPERDAVREFVSGYVAHPKERLRTGAMKALGTLADERSIPLLQDFVEKGDGESPEAKAAEAALKVIHGEQPQAAEVGALRKELMELQERVKELEADADEEKEEKEDDEDK
jgi:aminopeptidase N